MLTCQTLFSHSSSVSKIFTNYIEKSTNVKELTMSGNILTILASSLVFNCKIDKDTSQMLLGNFRVCTVGENQERVQGFKQSLGKSGKLFIPSVYFMFSLTKSANFNFSYLFG